MGQWRRCLTRQRSDANAIVLNHGELTRPVGATREGGNGRLNGMLWRVERNPKEHDSNRCRQAAAKCQLAEVLIERHNNPAFSLRTFQNVRIRTAGSIFVNPRDVTSIVSKSSDNRARNVLVGEQAGGHVYRDRIVGYTFSDCITALAYLRQA